MDAAMAAATGLAVVTAFGRGINVLTDNVAVALARRDPEQLFGIADELRGLFADGLRIVDPNGKLVVEEQPAFHLGRLRTLVDIAHAVLPYRAPPCDHQLHQFRSVGQVFKLQVHGVFCSG